MTATFDRDMALVQAAVNAVDLTRFATAVRNTLDKFGVESVNFRSYGLPAYSVSKEKNRSWRPPHHVVAGGAHLTEHKCTLYAPGLARRRSRGFGLNLSTLEVMCHETTHRLAGHRVRQGVYSDTDITYDGMRYVSGYCEMVMLDGAHKGSINDMLNEGVTQYFALELMREYLRLGWYMNVSKPAVERHFERVESWKLGAFYPEAVAFAEAILVRLGKGLGSFEAAHKMLLGGYFRAEPILTHEKWTTTLEECGLLQLVRKARVAQSDELRPLIARVQAGWTDRGVWEGISIQREET